jgi:hypothetical protein
MVIRAGMILVPLLVGGLIGAGIVRGTEKGRADRDLQSVVFVDHLSTTALCITTLTLLGDNRSDAAVTLLRDRLASSLAEVHQMEFSGASNDMNIPNLVEALRRAREYAQTTNMGPRVVAQADAVLIRLEQGH